MGCPIPYEKFPTSSVCPETKPSWRHQQQIGMWLYTTTYGRNSYFGDSLVSRRFCRTYTSAFLNDLLGDPFILWLFVALCINIYVHWFVLSGSIPVGIRLDNGWSWVRHLSLVIVNQNQALNGPNQAERRWWFPYVRSRVLVF